MGYIPLFLTLAGFVVLFILTVNQSLNTKRERILQFQKLMVAGFEQFGKTVQIGSKVSREGLASLEETFQYTKKNLNDSQQLLFDERIRKPYQMLKLNKAGYNKLVSKKPYSFAAKIMGHSLLS